MGRAHEDAPASPAPCSPSFFQTAGHTCPPERLALASPLPKFSVDSLRGEAGAGRVKDERDPRKKLPP